jgi:hypothetical protein
VEAQGTTLPGRVTIAGNDLGSKGIHSGIIELPARPQPVRLCATAPPGVGAMNVEIAIPIAVPRQSLNSGTNRRRAAFPHFEEAELMKQITVGVLGLALWLTGCSIKVGGDGGRLERPGEVVETVESVELPKAELVQVDLTMGAGKLVVEGGAKKLMEGEFRYNVASWKPEIRFEETGVRGSLSVKQGAGTAMGEARNEWHIRLADATPIDLAVNCGAGEGELDLRGLNLRSVQVRMGAGRLDLDLRSEYAKDLEASVEGGVGEATIYLPKGRPVEARAEGGIGKIKVQGLNKEGDLWVSGNEGRDKPVIRLQVKGGIGGINIYAE